MDTITLTRRQVVDLLAAFKATDVAAPFRFAYATGKTAQALAGEYEAIKGAELARQRDRLAIVERYGERDDAGALVTAEGGIRIRPDAAEQCQADIAAQNADADAFLSEPVAVSVHRCAWADFHDWQAVRLTRGMVDALGLYLTGEPPE